MSLSPISSMSLKEVIKVFSSKKNFESYVKTKNFQDGNTLYRPTIENIKRGMVIRFWDEKKKNQIGELVESVNYKDETLRVRHKIFSKNECYDLVDVEDVVWVREIGGYEKYMEDLKKLSGFIDNAYKLLK